MTSREIEVKKIALFVEEAKLVMDGIHLSIISDIVNSYEKILIECDKGK